MKKLSTNQQVFQTDTLRTLRIMQYNRITTSRSPIYGRDNGIVNKYRNENFNKK